jgi:hypothetical protein
MRGADPAPARGRLARLARRVGTLVRAPAAKGAPGKAARNGPRNGLILHLGDFKTGTTAIQTWLGRQGAAAGIATPPGFNQAELAQSLTHPDPAVAEQAFAALARILETLAPEARHIVISAEHFELADPARLAALIAGHLAPWQEDMRLIAYVRPHPQAFLARFAESTKIGTHDGTPERYLDLPHLRRRMTYAPRFTAWRSIFGNRFTLRLYDRTALTGGDVVRDFAGFVTGQDPGPCDILVNPTPGPADLALMRAFHRAIGPQSPATSPARQTLGRHLGRLLAAEAARNVRNDGPLRLHRDLAERLITVFTEDAAAMDATFFAGADRPLTQALLAARDSAGPLPVPLAPEDHLTPAALAVIALWGAMLRDGLNAPDGAILLNRIYHE